MTAILRSPGDRPTGQIERLANGAWRGPVTADAGLGDTYTAVVTSFGDFAIVSGTPDGVTASGGPAASAPAGGATGDSSNPVLVGAVALAIIAFLVLSDPRRRGRNEATPRSDHR